MGLTCSWQIGIELSKRRFLRESLSWRMSDEDPFSYKPLRVTKRRKKMLGGRRKGKKADLDIKEEVEEGIVEIFAGTK